MVQVTGLTKNTQNLFGKGIPDFIDGANKLIEVKNVKYLSLTDQIKRYMSIPGYQLEVWVREGTQISSQLKALGIVKWVLPW